jgi:hypothetical protein
VIIFGFGRGRPKDLGEVAPSKCPNCLRDVVFRHISVTRWFSLFFIPLIPFSTKHWLLCPVCTRGPQLDQAQRQAVDHMAEVTATRSANQVSHQAYWAEVSSFWQAITGRQANQQLPPETPSLPPPP